MSPRILLLSTLLLTACGEKNTFAPPPPTPVGVMSPIVRDQQSYSEYSGRVEALQIVEIRARANGILLKIGDEFAPGKRIKAEDTLFTIDDAPYQIAVEAAEASLTKATAAKVIADTTLEARTNAKLGVSNIERAAAKADVAQAVANILAETANLKKADLDLSYCYINAPIDGRISELFVDQFNLVGSGEDTLLCTIVQDDFMHIYFEADERRALEFLRRRKGYEDNKKTPPTAELTMADGEVYKPDAQIELAANRLDADTGTLRVRAVVENVDGKLADGLFVRLKIPHPDGPIKSVLVPTTAYQQDLGGFYVLVVGEGNKVIRKTIKLGERIDNRRLDNPRVDNSDLDNLRIVTEGLTGEEKLIVEGAQRIREGSIVAPSEVPPDDVEPSGSPDAQPESPAGN